MGRRRRAALLLGLAATLGGLAASDVGRREAALRAQLGPVTPVVVARRPLPAGRRVRAEDLGIRRVPSRYAPPGGSVAAGALVGGELAVPVPAGGAVSDTLMVTTPVTRGVAVRAGERAADVLATGEIEALAPGARVDVLVTREAGDAGAGGTRLALEDVEVLAAEAAPAATGGEPPGGPRVRATLRVTPRQAVYLAAAQAFAREIRLLARAPGDRAAVGRVEVDDGL